MTKVVRCAACGEMAAVGPKCAFCGAELPAGAVRQFADNAGSDRDETAENRDRAAELRDRGAETRDALASRHEQAASSGKGIASDRDQSWSDHDQIASGSDQRAADDDQLAADDDFAAGGDAATYERGLLARKQTHRDRSSASVSRDVTSAARLQGHEVDASPSPLRAEHGREEAASDREKSAHDREEAARDRAEAQRDSTASAAARSGPWRRLSR